MALVDEALEQPGDEILFCPGAYTLTSAVTINRPGITFRAQGNPYSARFDASATADIECFTIAAAGDYTTIKDLYITPDDSTTQVSAITVAGVGCLIDNCTFIGADATAAVACIDVNAADCSIINCRFYDFEQGVDLGAAARSIVRGCHFDSDNTAAIGVNCSAACNWSIIDGNIFYTSGGTGDYGVKVANTSLRVTISNNWFHPDVANPIDPGTQAGNDDTVMCGNKKGDETTAAWIAT